MSIKFTRERETKNTIRFKEAPEKGQEAVADTLYLKKSFLEENNLKDAESIEIEVRKVTA